MKTTSNNRLSILQIIALSTSPSLMSCGLSESGLFPEISLSFPDNVSENTSGASAVLLSASALGGGTGGGRETRAADNVISQWAGRIDGIVERTNEFLTKLDEQGVVAGTAVTFTKKEKSISILVSELSGDPDFTKQVVVCVNGTLMKHMKWNDDASKLELTRNFGVDPLTDREPSDFMAKLSLTTGTDGTVTGIAEASGIPFKVPHDHKDANETYLNERILLSKAADESFELGGVQLFSASAPTSFTANTGDAYFVGRILADGSASSVGWRSIKTGCTSITASSFNETTPNFCGTSSITTAGVFNFTADATAAATAYSGGLNSIDLPSSAELTEITFEEGVACPDAS